MKALTVALLAIGIAACSQRTSDTQKESPPAADNTKKNERDRGDTVKPTDQGENKNDVDITADIRKQVMSNHELSTKAQNVKIVTKDGVVTLRGPVETQEEKAYITAAAKNAPGAKSVDDQLEITAK